MKPIQYACMPVLLLLLITLPVQADWSQYLDSAKEALDSSGVDVPASGLSNDEMVAGLKSSSRKVSFTFENAIIEVVGRCDACVAALP